MQFSETVYGLFIILMPGIISGLVAVRMAWARGRNPFVWGLLTLLVPVLVLVIWSKPPLKEVPGGFRRCPSCGEWTKWKERRCKYCSADFTLPDTN
jgi:hypothetical protein